MPDAHSSARKPSDFSGSPWTFQAAAGVFFYSTDISGKWCIFCTPAEVDEAWSRVVGLLGERRLIAAKASTAAARRLSGHDSHVICVYTLDWRDEADVFRVREVLRSVGFNEPLKYKRDIDTMNPPDDPAREFYYEG